VVALLATVLFGCVDPLLGPEPPTDPVHNFDVLWDEFDRHYSFFRLKGVDWDALRAEYRPRVGPDTGEEALLDVVAAMLDRLEDGHVNVFTGVGVYGYTGWYTDRPASYLRTLVEDRFALGTAADGRLDYARLPDGTGYIGIRTFHDGMAEALDLILAGMQPLDGLIVDLRDNGGGSDTEAREMAGRLVDARRRYRTVRIRNGPEHDDFTPPIPWSVEPRGDPYHGPLVLLTNRRTFSAAESFVLAARTRSAGVTVVGDTTGGGSGFPMFRELPNGWLYRIPRWIAYDVDGRTFEGVGLPPDELIVFEDTASADPILERALELLAPIPAGSGS
jgi:hypothetical protein